MSTDYFELAFNFTMNLEGWGKLSMNTNDPGNWTGGKRFVGRLRGTKFGIAASAHPEIDIPNLTLPQAREIYRKQYWLAAGCDKLAWPLSAYVFDAAVQHGPSRARKWLSEHSTIDGFNLTRKKFLKSWSARNPGNRGVLTRVDKLVRSVESAKV